MRLVTTAILIGALASSVGAAPKRAVSPAVVSANNEPALRVGGTTLSRPFGAELVDRLSIVGTYPLRGETAYLIRGEAGTTCPARYIIASVKGRAAPVLTAPFGGCAPGATARVSNGSLLVTIPGAPGTPPARFTYAAGAVRPLTVTGAMTLAEPGCGAIRASAQATDLQSVLDQTLSPYEARSAVLRHTDFTRDDLQGLVVDLACLATVPNGDRPVARRANDLFASKRHGEAAFAALDEVARTPMTSADLRAAVRRFSAEMRFQLGKRTVI